MVAYVLEGPSWTSTGTGGPTVTWAIDNSIPVAWTSLITSAFATWAQYGNIHFQQVASTATAAIDFALQPIDGLNQILGEASYSYTGRAMQGAQITFDRDEGWHASGDRIVSNSGTNLFLVALHEIGHSLGLGHENDVPAVMSSYINNSLTTLTASDIGGIRALYGNATSTGSDFAHQTFRFYDTVTGDHFYTSSVAERQQILATLPTFVDEGTPWATPDAGPGTHDVFRFYDTVSHNHFFTESTAERDTIMRILPSFHYEGVGFQAYDQAGGAGTITLARFYNVNTHAHHFAPAAEADGIRHGAAGAGWVDEGIGFTVHVPVDGMHSL